MVFGKILQRRRYTRTHLLIIIKLIFLSFFLVHYSILLHFPASFSDSQEHGKSTLRCRSAECKDPKAGNGREELTVSVRPSFLNGTGGSMKIGAVNMDAEDVFEWKAHGEIVRVTFERVSKSLEWQTLFPEWIDEEEEFERPSCPHIPMPDFDNYGYMDMIMVKLPCRFPKKGWNRDVFTLQLHLVAANLAIRIGKRDRAGKTKVVFMSKCMPMVELFRCDELEDRGGDWWYYRPEVVRLEQKLALPVGSCKLAMPLPGKEMTEISKPKIRRRKSRTVEAYATVLHSSEVYVCGAITLAQSLLRTGTKRDLILLLDTSIHEYLRRALSKAGWKLKFIQRIANPKLKRNEYNKYNYSKFRLWQLTDYEKIIFIDSDILVLRNLDNLFHFPEMTATGNDGHLFNSGIMVIEPSNRTFSMLMNRTKEIVSSNGGDQGFLNEVFVWWHRLPRRVNFLKNFWSNSSEEVSAKNKLFASDPPEVYTIHYLGWKPWYCYRDYDCNFDQDDHHMYASDIAHAQWWKLYDSMNVKLQKYCGLPGWRKDLLEERRQNATRLELGDKHWKIKISDPRKFT